MGTDDKVKPHWSVDKRIPIALIVTICIQSMAAVWWAAKTDEKVLTLQEQVHNSGDLKERVIRLEVIAQNQNVLLEQILDELKKR